MTILPPAKIGGGLLPDHPDLAGITVTEVLRNRPDHAVLAVTLNERPYFLKLFRRSTAADEVRATVGTLAQAAEALGQAENAVVRLRMASPEAGVILLDPVRGTQLTTCLAAAGVQRRNILIARAGCWLAALSADRERARFGPGFWLKGLEARVQAFDPTADPEADLGLITRQIEAMHDLASSLRGAEVERGTIHGDFTPDNFYLDGARLVGIDMQRPQRLAVARDVARFLVWLQSRRSEMPEVLRHGVSAADYAAICAVPGLLSRDQEPILRFMMGEIMAAYYLEAAGKRLRREMLARAMERWQLG